MYEATGLQEVFNDSNISVVLKSSPDKTVAALSPLAEKEGQVRVTALHLNSAALTTNISMVQGSGGGLYL